MDRRLEGDQRKDVCWLHVECTTGGTPRSHSSDELTEELHRSLGLCRARRHVRSGNARRNDSSAGSV